MRPASFLETRRRVFKLLLSAPAIFWSRDVIGQTPGAGTPAPPAATAPQPAQPGRVFASDAGLILNTIKPDKTADFELVVQRLKAALQQSGDPQRKQQSVGWRVYKALEPGANNSVLYVFWLDPVVKGADYTVSKILYEAFPAEAQELYHKFSGSYSGGQTLVNLQLLSNLGQPA
jgi:hypothetical protein